MMYISARSKAPGSADSLLSRPALTAGIKPAAHVYSDGLLAPLVHSRSVGLQFRHDDVAPNLPISKTLAGRSSARICAAQSSESIAVNTPENLVSIALRIPGTWSHPKDLVERLPPDCKLSEEALILPDGTSVEFGVLKADNQFAKIFRSSCRKPATEKELAIVDAYRVNITLYGPGGSLEAALKMMQAASVIVQAGGAGVFIDNCTLAHGGAAWEAMCEDGGPDALSFAFVAIVRNSTDVWTMGMHALGFRDLVMSRVEADKFDIIEVIRYVSRGERPIQHGDLIADLDGPRFQALEQSGTDKLAGTPMHNPFGRLRLVSMRDVAETN